MLNDLFPLPDDSDKADSDKEEVKRSRKTSSSKDSTGDHKSSKSYDYKTKLNYLFRETRFFVIKSNNADNVTLSKTKNVWSTLPQNEANLNQAFRESRNVLLIFSVKESGKFAGLARMNSESRRDGPAVGWVLPPGMSAKQLGGVFKVDWLCRKELSFNCTAHLFNPWNDMKPVKIGRDGQEIEGKVGAELCRLFPEDDAVDMTPILKRSKESAKQLRERGGSKTNLRKPIGGGSGGGGGGGGGGYHGGGGHHRSFGGRNAPTSSSSFRSGRPPPLNRGPPSMPMNGAGGARKKMYLGGSGAGGGGGRSSKFHSRSPPLSSSASSSSATHHAMMYHRMAMAMPPPPASGLNGTAAAEAYVAEYMRTMHLPYAPPPGYNPLSSYDALMPLPPPRYYDALPLPEYPPPVNSSGGLVDGLVTGEGVLTAFDFSVAGGLVNSSVSSKDHHYMMHGSSRTESAGGYHHSRGRTDHHSSNSRSSDRDRYRDRSNNFRSYRDRR